MEGEITGGTAVAVIPTAMPAVKLDDVVQQVRLVEQCVKSIMTDKLHYGTIPGCGDKPTLLKPGAEMLAKLFQLRPEYSRDIADLGNGHRDVRVMCKLFSRATGLEVGEGAGSCSTMESKYRWRKAQRACPKCGKEGTILRSKFPPKYDPKAQPGWYCYSKQGGCGAEFAYDAPEIRNQQSGRVENPDIADAYNTVQKMADKRAYVAAVITTVGASDFVTQDIEDFADYRPDTTPVVTEAVVTNSAPHPARVEAPAAEVAPTEQTKVGTLSKEQIDTLKDAIAAHEISRAQWLAWLKEHESVEGIAYLPPQRYDAVLEFVNTNPDAVKQNLPF